MKFLDGIIMILLAGLAIKGFYQEDAALGCVSLVGVLGYLRLTHSDIL